MLGPKRKNVTSTMAERFEGVAISSIYLHTRTRIFTTRNIMEGALKRSADISLVLLPRNLVSVSTGRKLSSKDDNRIAVQCTEAPFFQAKGSDPDKQLDKSSKKGPNWNCSFNPATQLYTPSL
jgi:hypothetical protein